MTACVIFGIAWLLMSVVALLANKPVLAGTYLACAQAWTAAFAIIAALS